MLKGVLAGCGRMFRSNGGINYGLFLIAVLFFLVMAVTPAPKSMVELVSSPSPVGYSLQPGTTTITGSVNKLLKLSGDKALTPDDLAYKAKIMLAVLVASAFLWATEAIPLGATDLLVGAVLYIFTILPLDSIAEAYMKDAVFFIAGVLTIAVGVGITGLDRRIGLLLLGRIGGLKAYFLLFFPCLAVAGGFFSAHALTAILVPILVRI